MTSRVTALLAPLLLLLVGCAGGSPAPAVRDDRVVVASFDFPESVLLAEVYAQALEQAGVPVRRELRLGPRELVLPALRQGQVDVVPEYLGTALTALGGGDLRGVGVAEASRRLSAALAPEDLLALEPAAAQDQNGLVVTRALADRLQLSTTSDLVPHAERLVLVGPPECPRRPLCLPGLRSAYGLEFARFVDYPLPSQRQTALAQGIADVAVAFTTDGRLAGDDLVLLADDRRLQPVENVVPVVSRRAVDRWPALVGALDAVSARLDLTGLRFLSWRTEVAGRPVRDEARGWLLRQGLVPR